MGRRRVLRDVLPVFFVASLLLCSACASKWSMKTEPEEAQIQWPQSPEPPKVRHVMSLNGFKETGASFGSIVRSIIFGGTEDQDITRPVAVSVGSDGRMAVADIGSKCVHLFVPKEQQYFKVFKADSLELSSPVGVAFDDGLRLYVSDSALNRIFVYDGGGTYLFSMNLTGSPALERSTGLAFDRGRKILYAANTLGNRIYGLTEKGDIVFSFGGRGIGDGQFNYPTHIFFSASGLLYVTDTMNFRVQIFDSTGKFVSAFGRHGDGSGDFAMPKGVASDKEGVIYVVDSLFDNIQLFNMDGQFLLTLGARGTAQGEFWLPSGIFIDAGDKLYVCDTYNGRVQVFQIFPRQKESEKGD